MTRERDAAPNGGSSPAPEPKDVGKSPSEGREAIKQVAAGTATQAKDGINEQKRLVIGWVAKVVDGALESQALRSTSTERVFEKALPCPECEPMRQTAGDRFRKSHCTCMDGLQHTLSDKVVTILRKDLAAHSVIIAQSGSGKSYLLGSLLEEVVLRTGMDLTILDPNADFRLFCVPDSQHVRGKDCKSKNPSYMAWTEHDGKLSCNDWWNDTWRNRVKADEMVFLESASEKRSKLVADEGAKSQPPQFAWEFFSPELLAAYERVGSVDPKFVGQMRAIHDFVQQISQFRLPSGAFRDPSAALKELGSAAKSANPETGAKDLLAKLRNSDGSKATYDQRLESAVRVAVNALWVEDQNTRGQKVDDAIEPYERGYKYFFATAGLVKTRSESETQFNERPPSRRSVSIYDLLGAEGPGNRAEIAYLALRRIWKHATARFRDQAEREAERPEGGLKDGIRPHLVVIDEAHNLAPGNESLSSHPVAVLLRDLIVTIAAEGRKFGIHLLLVSQRPDKVDRRVLSECVNQIIMRVSSDEVLRNCAPLFNLNFTDEQIRLVKSFGLGHGLLAGGWARNAMPGDRHPTYFVGCGRRTEEGSPSVPQGWLSEPVTALARDAYTAAKQAVSSENP
jgi:hypothetical protein